jgi:hypothetical protein
MAKHESPFMFMWWNIQPESQRKTVPCFVKKKHDYKLISLSSFSLAEYNTLEEFVIANYSPADVHINRRKSFYDTTDGRDMKNIVNSDKLNTFGYFCTEGHLGGSVQHVDQIMTFMDTLPKRKYNIILRSELLPIVRQHCKGHNVYIIKNAHYGAGAKYDAFIVSTSDQDLYTELVLRYS